MYGVRADCDAAHSSYGEQPVNVNSKQTYYRVNNNNAKEQHNNNVYICLFRNFDDTTHASIQRSRLLFG